ncbi:MAG TPA: purine nucleoside permease [Opitutus sp.]|nr:purine nucleoside permease [Opitutus sp.]
MKTPRLLPVLLSCLALASLHAERIAPKVIVLAGFEVGADSGDAPGEFQYWVEREKLDGTLEVPGAPHHLRFNSSGLYASVSGSTATDHELSTVPASELVMAICLDPRLDVSHSYWLITGIAGIDPEFGSIGSTVWAANVVDGDAMREIDEREVPAGWPNGLFAIGTMQPGQLPVINATAGGWGGATLAYTMNYALNPALTRWAYEFSRDHATLADEPALKSWREKFTGLPAAQQPPQIQLGATLASARYWHGPSRTQWARDWVKLWTKGGDRFATTAMEQAAYAGTLHRMAARGFLDFNRVLMLRGASNYCTPPPGQPVLSTIGDESIGTLAAFESEYRAGAAVVHELLAHWDRYETKTPGTQ